MQFSHIDSLYLAGSFSVSIFEILRIYFNRDFKISPNVWTSSVFIAAYQVLRSILLNRSLVFVSCLVLAFTLLTGVMVHFFHKSNLSKRDFLRQAFSDWPYEMSLVVILAISEFGTKLVA